MSAVATPVCELPTAQKATKACRVVVTGMGAVSPIGDSLETIWASIEQGRPGIKRMSAIAPGDTTCKVAGEIPDFDPEQYVEKKEARRMDRYMQFAAAAAKLAMAHSGARSHVPDDRLGVVVGSGAGGMITIENTMRKAIEQGFHRISPFFVPMMLPDLGAGHVSILNNAKGPNRSVVTACATGSDSIGDACRLIQEGRADVMIAGGAEAPITAIAVGGFTAARTLSNSDTPETASRPFDTARDGFVIAEGAGVLILESLEHAQARGATIYAELVGYGSTSDANDIVAPCADGDGAARAMILALEDAGLAPEDIQYLNAHATSTPVGDIAEITAIKRVFGIHATSKQLAISGTKSMHGHLLGGTGALEAIICILAMQNNTLPPTINLDSIDPACAELDLVPNTSRKVENLHTVMSNSFGFGGHNACLIFKKFTA